MSGTDAIKAKSGDTLLLVGTLKGAFRSQLSDVIVDPHPEMRLYDRGGPVGHHVAIIVEPSAQQHGARRQSDGQHQVLDRFAVEHLAQYPAQEAEPSDAGGDGQQTDENGPSDAQPHALGERP